MVDLFLTRFPSYLNDSWLPSFQGLFYITSSTDVLESYRYWDTRQQTPVHTQQLPDRCYSLTVRYPLMVVGTADRNLVVFDLQKPQVNFVYVYQQLYDFHWCFTYIVG